MHGHHHLMRMRARPDTLNGANVHCCGAYGATELNLLGVWLLIVRTTSRAPGRCFVLRPHRLRNHAGSNRRGHVGNAV